jgi:ribosomal protein S18 acetylase RimI-like enzyme
MNRAFLPSVAIRKAEAGDLPEIARLMRQWSTTAWKFMVVHPPEADLRFIEGRAVVGSIWTAFEGERIVGFCTVRRGWIDVFHVAPERHGQGIGRALLAQALKGRRRVRLWTFQRNTRARRFYALQGFREVRLTDGRDNEEREPDVLVEWRRG